MFPPMPLPSLMLPSSLPCSLLSSPRGCFREPRIRLFPFPGFSSPRFSQNTQPASFFPNSLPASFLHSIDHTWAIKDAGYQASPRPANPSPVSACSLSPDFPACVFFLKTYSPRFFQNSLPASFLHSIDHAWAIKDAGCQAPSRLLTRLLYPPRLADFSKNAPSSCIYQKFVIPLHRISTIFRSIYVLFTDDIRRIYGRYNQLNNTIQLPYV